VAADGSAGPAGPPAGSPPLRRSSLRRAVAKAFAPLVAAVAAAAVCQVALARTVHRDVRRLFEELREVALARTLVDELDGIQQWVSAAPAATPATQPLVFDDVRQHHAAAAATLARFVTPDDPSTAAHERQEGALLAELRQWLQRTGDALRGTASLGEVASMLAPARHAAATLAATIDRESRSIGDELDRRSDDMAGYLLLLGLVSAATLGALGWLLLRRVLQPVRALQRAAVRLGNGDLDAPLPPQRGDELGDLAATFGTMAARLRQARDELESRVEQRSREVLRSARLAQLGTLAAGIAHEINNPLASIVAGTEGLLRDLDRGERGDDAATREYLQLLHKEALRARDITARLLRLARQDPARRETVWLGEELREVAALFAHQLQRAGVRLDLGGESPGPAIVGDAAEWRQVLFNLLRNALDASPNGGAIRASARIADGDAQLTVADEGPGVPAELQDRVFEPFFTTKPPGRGTGLGLAIVHRIVEAHGGTVQVANGSRGACFTVRVPLAGAPPP
jgi:signal transduction histidine kinase